jgi:hypothetical protein
LLVASVPLFELIFITAMRIRKGLPWWRGSPDHFSLRSLGTDTPPLAAQKKLQLG